MNNTEKVELPDQSRGKLRFSIGQLLVVTAVVSVVLLVMVTLVPGLWSLAMERESRGAFFDALLGPAFPSVMWQQYVPRVPRMLAWVVGGVLLARRWKRHPRVSLRGLAGLAGLLVLELVGIGLSLWRSIWLQAQGNVPGVSPVPPRYFDVLITFQFYLRPVVEGCCWVLILMAVLSWRGEEPRWTDVKTRAIDESTRFRHRWR